MAHLGRVSPGDLLSLTGAQPFMFEVMDGRLVATYGCSHPTRSQSPAGAGLGLLGDTRWRGKGGCAMADYFRRQGLIRPAKAE